MSLFTPITRTLNPDPGSQPRFICSYDIKIQSPQSVLEKRASSIHQKLSEPQARKQARLRLVDALEKADAAAEEGDALIAVAQGSIPGSQRRHAENEVRYHRDLTFCLGRGGWGGGGIKGTPCSHATDTESWWAHGVQYGTSLKRMDRNRKKSPTLLQETEGGGGGGGEIAQAGCGRCELERVKRCGWDMPVDNALAERERGKLAYL